MNPGMIAAIAAVMIDSVVTLAVGFHLSKTARREIAKGVEDVVAHAPTIIADAMGGKNTNDA